MCSKNDTASSYIADFTSSVNSGKRVVSTTRELVEAVEAEPLTEELGRKTPSLRVRKHALHLAFELLRIAQFACGSRSPEFVVGNEDHRK